MDQDHQPPADGDPTAVAAQRRTAKPAPPTPSGAPPPERWSRRPWLYIAGIFLLGMCSGQPDGGDSAERLGNLVGDGIATLLMSVVFVSIFLVWRRSSRPRIPGAAFIAALVMVAISRGEATREKEEQFAALQGLADSTFGTGDDSDPPPRDSNARMLWASRKAMEDLLAQNDARARAHGVDVDNPPGGWLSAAYLANAGKHPEVGTYFTRYQAYVREADSTFVPVFTERMRARLVQSGLARAQIDGFMRGVGRSVERNAAQKQLTAALELTDQALALHAYLVSVDSRVHLDDAEEVAMFEREAERLHATEIVGRIERLGREIEAQQRRGRDRLLELGDSMGIEADTVDRASPRAEPRTDAASKS